MTQSAPATARAGSISQRSAMPSSMTRSKVAWVRALATISPARSRRSRAMRATELPISPMPISARRRNRGSAMRGLAGHELGERIGDDAAFLAGADGDAQAVRQVVGGHAAHDDAARFQERIGAAGALGGAETGQ